MPDPILQILTANRLHTGDVLYWRSGEWVGGLADSEMFSDDAMAAAALAAAQVFVGSNQIVSPYLFEVRREKNGLRPVKEREIIRSRGPSVRPDTGKQALHVQI